MIAAVDLREHGQVCVCEACSTVRLYLAVDAWEAAVHLAFEAELVDEGDFEVAFVSGADVLQFAGFCSERPKACGLVSELEALDAALVEAIRAAEAELEGDR